MFPPGRLMQFLRHINLNSHSCYSANGPIDGDGLRCIAQACPVLESLGLRHSLQSDVDLSPLLQLPASCTSLQGAGPALTDAAAPVVAQLTQLRRLSWQSSSELTDVGLEQLTGLNLSSLHLALCGTSRNVERPGVHACLGSLLLTSTP
jgi:hypothetical protein